MVGCCRWYHQHRLSFRINLGSHFSLSPVPASGRSLILPGAPITRRFLFCFRRLKSIFEPLPVVLFFRSSLQRCPNVATLQSPHRQRQHHYTWRHRHRSRLRRELSRGTRGDRTQFYSTSSTGSFSPSPRGSARVPRGGGFRHTRSYRLDDAVLVDRFRREQHRHRGGDTSDAPTPASSGYFRRGQLDAAFAA